MQCKRLLICTDHIDVVLQGCLVLIPYFVNNVLLVWASHDLNCFPALHCM